MPVALGTLDDHPGLAEPEETGTTFAANARLKALYYAGATGELTVAEDSGLEIDALNGEPGVRSARFNGESYADKFAAIRRMLAERGTDTSMARFVCALALARAGGILWETAGIVEGRLQLLPRGGAGFLHEVRTPVVIVDISRREEFQGNRAFELGVLGFVDDTHPALTDFLGDLVVRDGFADH